MNVFREWFPAPTEARSRQLNIPLDLMDVAAALKDSDHFVFLDSADTLGRYGQFSILAWEPILIFRSKNNAARIWRDGRWSKARGNPFDLLAQAANAVLRPGLKRPPLPFVGGAIGYFAYDLFRYVERYKRLMAADVLRLPDCCLAFYDSALLSMHESREWFLVGAGEHGVKALLDRKKAQLFSRLERPVHRLDRRKPPGDGKPKVFSSNFTKENYMKLVETALEHIYAGDIYQVNLSQRFQTAFDGSPFDLFRTLRAINPSRYGAYLQYPDHAVVSASPELFLTTSGRQVETRPVKGTRPRGATPEADERLKRDLQASEKDRAELSMIVDLERNDLGRVCEYGSVRVHEHAYIDTLPTVFHTVSTVRGVLREDVGPVDLIRATFPGGSVTGCPKIRSIEIIDRLEPTRRHVYCGAIGFIDFCGDLTLNIPIRTLIAKGNEVSFQVGGGIVADSDPEAEYVETLDKAKAMMDALQAVDRTHE